jgi:hypothetical protein
VVVEAAGLVFDRAGAIQVMYSIFVVDAVLLLLLVVLYLAGVIFCRGCRSPFRHPSVRRCAFSKPCWQYSAMSGEVIFSTFQIPSNSRQAFHHHPIWR